MSDTSSVLRPWPQRWWLYLHQMFQPGSRLVFSLLSTLGGIWAVQALHGSGLLRLPATLALGTLSLLLILLYYRLCDEFKDLDTDRRFFPERPVPSGQVTLTDLGRMRLGASLLAWALNGLWPVALGPFAALYLFAWGMGKWFFLPELIGNNRLLAFLTHSPISVFGSFYVMALACAPAGIPLLQAPHLALAAWFALPGMAWEVARKTRPPAAEQPGYQTYSSQLGPRLAALLPPLLTLANLAVGLWLQKALALPPVFGAVLTGLSLLYLLPFGLFFWRQEAYAAWLKPASEAYTALLLVLLPLSLGLTRGVAWPTLF
ncbi:MAG: hypothetical protein ACO1RX_22420 [Candidatus Sericytochromatia bacterium]